MMKKLLFLISLIFVSLLPCNTAMAATQQTVDEIEEMAYNPLTHQ